MTKLAWVAIPALTLGISMGCGSDSGTPPPAADGSTSSDGGGHKGTGGSSGKHTGGASESGGAHPDSGVEAGPPADTTPPTFDGATKVEALGEDRARVSWKLATDPPPGSPQNAISYRVYRAAKSGAEDFTATRRCGDPLADAGPLEQADAPCFVLAPAGSTSLIVHDAIPAHQFFYVVHAVDEAGNEDDNTKEVSATNSDVTAPDFGGIASVSVNSATSIEVTWNAGYDLGASDTSLVFKVYVAAGAPPDTTQPAMVTSKPGQHSIIVKGLQPLTSYYVIVRAADPSGNTDTNSRVLSVTTPEGVPPTFAGAKLASADGLTVRVFWPPATDNTTDSANIVYDVYESLVTHQFDYTKPNYTSKPGASSIAIDEPNAGTGYYFVVRARDAAGNRDGNFHQVSTTTGGLVDKTPPLFSGPQGITSITPTTLQVNWLTANETPVTYLVYASTSDPVPLTTPAVTTSALTATVAGLLPGTTYNVVVLAQDFATPPNVSTTVVSVQGTTLAATTDTTAPTGTGTPGASKLPSVPSTELKVSWAAASDDVDGANVRYHVCVGVKQSDCAGSAFASHIAATTAFGTTSAVLSNLTSRTSYFIDVRAEDHAGNLETTDHFTVGTTPVSWATDVSKILFDRCVACHEYQVHAAIYNVAGNLLDPKGCSADAGINGCQLKLIDPGRPAFSIIYRKVNPFGLKSNPFSASVPNQYNGAEEPRDTPDKLSADEDQALLDWINDGAYAN